MGNRGSIQVIDSTEGDGEGMLETVKQAVEYVKKHIKRDGISDPYSRGDAGVIIALLTKFAIDEIEYSAYLGKSVEEVDNSDNGHFILKTSEEKRVLYNESVPEEKKEFKIR